jgi:beta-galactosidase
VILRGTVDNSLPRAIVARLEHTILDGRGKEITRATAEMELPASGSAAFRNDGVSIPSPRLWSPSDPHLYRVITEIFHQDSLVDRVVNSFGVRSFRADPARGFFLNGVPLRLNGTNRHQDRAGYGNALPDALHRRDVEIIKEDGFNFLRLAHYPQDSAVLEAADRLGLVVWEEIPIVNLIGMSDAFAENSERMLVEMIRQHYNHPSIVFWGYMNEVMLTRPNPIPEGYYQRMLELTRRLEARAKAEDPGRLTVMALSREEVPPEDHGLGSITDVLAFNFYFGWYYEKLETLGSFLDEFHRAYPSRPLMVSEYGAGSDERVHSTKPVPFDFSSEYAQIFHLSSFSQMEQRPYLVGTAIWNHFDFASEARSDSKPTLNQKGMYFHDRTPKDTAFYYRAALLDEPVLHIGREWLRRAGSRAEERVQPVWAYTNFDEVTFFVNGVNAGSVLVENRRAETKALLVAGPNQIRAMGRRGEQSFTDEVTIIFNDRSLTLSDPEAMGLLVAVNAGSDYAYVDDAGVVWEADRAWERGGWGFVGGVPGRTHHRISSTEDDPLLQPSREGMDAYRFDVPDGVYEVEIALAERDRRIAAGDRVFSVVANGIEIITDLDLVANVGHFAAVRRKAIVEVINGEGIEIGFSASAGKPLVAAILIRR